MSDPTHFLNNLFYKALFPYFRELTPFNMGRDVYEKAKEVLAATRLGDDHHVEEVVIRVFLTALRKLWELEGQRVAVFGQPRNWIRKLVRDSVHLYVEEVVQADVQVVATLTEGEGTKESIGFKVEEAVNEMNRSAIKELPSHEEEIIRRALVGEDSDQESIDPSQVRAAFESLLCALREAVSTGDSEAVKRLLKFLERADEEE